MHVVEFVAPVVGVDGDFNTFRLGLRYGKILKPGDKVALVDTKGKLLIGFAEVFQINSGKLGELLLEFAATNHAMKGSDPMTAPERLRAVLQKFYGPHIATVTRSAVVLHLRRIDGDVSEDGALRQLALWETQGNPS